MESRCGKKNNSLFPKAFSISFVGLACTTYYSNLDLLKLLGATLFQPFKTSSSECHSNNRGNTTNLSSSFGEQPGGLK